MVDGDTPAGERAWARAHANYLLTNPDMLHHALLPRHARWDGFFRRLRYVIVDECHGYRGVFGSHVAQVLRRLRRVSAHPAVRPHRRPGLPARPRPRSASPSAAPGCSPGWTPVAVTDGLRAARAGHLRAVGAAAHRRSAARRARRCAGPPPPRRPGCSPTWSAKDVPALAFVRSRRGAEAVALGARRTLAEAGAADLAPRVAAYRSGYLPEDRRALEEALHAGRLLGLATTTALELGVNICGLDAVLIAGWPGTRAALWQQAGRAGRGRPGRGGGPHRPRRPAGHLSGAPPEALLHQPVEATVLDPDNPYVLAPHLCAAAAELPLTEADLELFGPSAPPVPPT